MPEVLMGFPDLSVLAVKSTYSYKVKFGDEVTRIRHAAYSRIAYFHFTSSSSTSHLQTSLNVQPFPFDKTKPELMGLRGSLFRTTMSGEKIFEGVFRTSNASYEPSYKRIKREN